MQNSNNTSTQEDLIENFILNLQYVQYEQRLEYRYLTIFSCLSPFNLQLRYL